MPEGNLAPSSAGFETLDVSRKVLRPAKPEDQGADFRQIFDVLPQPAWVHDADGRWLSVNDSVCELLGYSRAELLERRLPEITHPDDLARNVEFMEKARRGEIESYSVEQRYLRKNGTLLWASAHVRLLRDSSGEAVCFISVLGDAGVRQGEEEAMRKHSQELLHGVLDSLPAQIAVLDPHGKIIAVNRAWQRFADENGAPLNTAPGINYLLAGRKEAGAAGVKTADAVSGVQCVLDDSLSEFEFEFALESADTVPRWFSTLATPLSREHGGAVITQMEITDRHRAETALRASHTLLREIVEGTTDAVYVKDLQGRYTMMNSAGAASLGRTIGQVIGKSARDLFRPDVARQVMAQDLEVVASGRAQTFRTRMDLLGKEHDFLATKGVCRNEEGEIIGIFGISRDITELNRANEALTNERNLLRTLLDALPDPIFVKDAECRFLLNSAAHLRLLGASSQEEIFGRDDFDYFPKELAENYFADDQEVIASGQPLIDRFETTLDQNHETRCMRTTKVPLRDSSGQVIGLVGVHRDITARRRAEQQVARLALIVESSSDAIISTNFEGKVVSWNKAAERIFGYTAEEMIGQSPVRLSAPGRRAETRRLQALVRSGEFLKEVETQRQTKDGKTLDVAVTLSPIFDAERQVVGASVIARDITERKRMEREILEISENEKRRIGQDLHDDLCQYLVGISLLANVLHDNLLQEQRKEAEDAREINRLVSQAITKARSIAKGLAPLELSGIGFMNACQELSIMVQRLFNIACELECEQPVEIADASAAVHFYRIAQEAVHNAAKHSNGTRIIIRLVLDGTGLILSVEDDGVGGAAAARSGGLGLHTMKYRARMIGAQLEFRRGVPRGTIVRCHLPRQG